MIRSINRQSGKPSMPRSERCADIAYPALRAIAARRLDRHSSIRNFTNQVAFNPMRVRLISREPSRAVGVGMRLGRPGRGWAFA